MKPPSSTTLHLISSALWVAGGVFLVMANRPLLSLAWFAFATAFIVAAILANRYTP